MFMNVIVHHIRIFNPDVIIPISDTFLLEKDGIGKLQLQKTMLMPYVMIDSYNLPDYSDPVLKPAKKIFTGSKHGQKMLKEEGYESEVLFHGVDFSKYKPVSKEKQKELTDLITKA